MVVVLPVPLTPATRMTKGFLSSVDLQRLLHRRQHGGDFRRQHGFQFGRRDLRIIAVLGDALRDAVGRACAHIGADQGFFQFGNGVGIQLLLGQDLAQARLGQAGLQPLEESGRRRGFAEGSHAADACQVIAVRGR